jgi:hypothetical protein
MVFPQKRSFSAGTVTGNLRSRDSISATDRVKVSRQIATRIAAWPRFALGDDVFEPYKATIDRWVCPDVMRNQDISIFKAKKAILDYKKAIGRPEGFA